MHGNPIRSLAFKLLILLLLPCYVAAADVPHPFHISTAEMELNKKSGRFEVALKLHAADLEQTLSTLEKRKINIDKDADAQQLLTSYLESHFFLIEKDKLRLNEEGPTEIDPMQAMSKVHYVGHELKTNWLWIYFEVELLETDPKPSGKTESDAAPSHMVLVNSVLLDVTDGQINTVAVRQAGKKYSLRTTARQAWAEMKFEV